MQLRGIGLGADHNSKSREARVFRASVAAHLEETDAAGPECLFRRAAGAGGSRSFELHREMIVAPAREQGAGAACPEAFSG